MSQDYRNQYGDDDDVVITTAPAPVEREIPWGRLALMAIVATGLIVIAWLLWGREDDDAEAATAATATTQQNVGLTADDIAAAVAEGNSSLATAVGGLSQRVDALDLAAASNGGVDPTSVPTMASEPTAQPSATTPSGTAPTPEPENNDAGVCESRHDYELWSLIELSADTEFIHVQWHRVDQNKDPIGPEFETLLPAGRYIVADKFGWAGHVWEIGPNCSVDQALLVHVAPSIERRLAEQVDTRGYVHWTTLLDEGLISKMVMQWEPVPTVPATLDLKVANVQAEPAATCNDASPGPDLEMTNMVTGPATIELWGPGGFSQLVVIPPDESWSFTTTYGGAIWLYAGCTADQIVEKETSQGKSPQLVSDLPGGIATQQ